MNQKHLLAVIAALVFILGSFVGFQVRGWTQRPQDAPDPIVKRDTCWLHDTTKIALPRSQGGEDPRHLLATCRSPGS